MSVNCIFNFGMHVQTTPSYSLTTYDRGLNTNRDILDRWTPDNPDGKFPRLINSSDRPEEYSFYDNYPILNNLDIYVKKQNYFRFQSIRLAYDLPTRWLKPIGVKSASVSLEDVTFGSSPATIIIILTRKRWEIRTPPPSLKVSSSDLT